jgi:prepilin-type N-terminal cleavage/methylation domain-containing protein/prepilin-type processing-associated H-X9-DG protein
MKHRSKHAFTLIELLVVIAIIAILAAILFPVFAQARDKARQSTCLSNVKQLSVGALMYAQDYDEHLICYPGSKHCNWRYICEKPQRFWLDWWDAVLPYTKNNRIYDCPAARPYHDITLSSFDIRNVAIGYNMSPSAGNSLVKNVPDGDVYPGVALAEVTRPADTIMLGEAGHVWNPKATAAPFNSSDQPSPSLSFSPSNESGSEWGPEPRHGGGSSMGFVDGHARWMKLESFYGVTDVANKKITLDCNGIWFRTNRDAHKPGDPPAPACGQSN